MPRASSALGVADRAGSRRSVKEIPADHFRSGAIDGGRGYFEQLLGLTDDERGASGANTKRAPGRAPW